MNTPHQLSLFSVGLVLLVGNFFLRSQFLVDVGFLSASAYWSTIPYLLMDVFRGSPFGVFLGQGGWRGTELDVIRTRMEFSSPDRPAFTGHTVALYGGFYFNDRWAGG